MFGHINEDERGNETEYIGLLGHLLECFQGLESDHRKRKKDFIEKNVILFAWYLYWNGNQG